MRDVTPQSDQPVRDGQASLSDEADLDPFDGYEGRRLKAAIALLLLWLVTVYLHKVSWGHGAVLAVAALMSIQALRVIFARQPATPVALPSAAAVSGAAGDFARDSLSPEGPDSWPYVTLMVAAKNEEQVIDQIVASLSNLDYPKDRYDLWFIDDCSSDHTGAILDQWAQRAPRINVVHRGPDATGGKSGALNLVWPQTKGELLAVFDADAQVRPDLLRHVVPMFTRPGTEKVGAVQIRKAIANAETNLWTKGQRAEMALDAYMQAKRIAIGGIGELRGNGQFVRRAAIAQCGGWNEETITDDLDLTIQLHLNQWNIGLLFSPAVGEEGVTNAVALWHQRNRWAEGGFQRYLDYWRPLAKNRIGWLKSLDMAGFWIIQYMLPVVALPDLLLALYHRHLPLYGPMTAMAVTLSGLGMFTTLRQTENMSVPKAAWHTGIGSIYMLHWLVVIGTMAMRISVRPKQLKWVKTDHGVNASAQEA